MNIFKGGIIAVNEIELPSHAISICSTYGMELMDNGGTRNEMMTKTE